MNKVPRHQDEGRSMGDCISDYLTNDLGGSSAPLKAGRTVGAGVGGAAGGIVGAGGTLPTGPGAAAGGLAGAGAGGALGYDVGEDVVRGMAQNHCKEKICPSK